MAVKRFLIIKTGFIAPKDMTISMSGKLPAVVQRDERVVFEKDGSVAIIKGNEIRVPLPPEPAGANLESIMDKIPVALWLG